MFEAIEGAAALTQHVLALGERLAVFDGGLDGGAAADLIALVAALEVLKCRAEGAQVMATVAFDAAQRAEQAAAGVPVARQGQGVGLQVALARRESHNRGQRHLGLARTLAGSLPCTLAALRRGEISEWRATLVARETACLSREHQAQVDHLLGASWRWWRAADARVSVSWWGSCGGGRTGWMPSRWWRVVVGPRPSGRCGCGRRRTR